VRYLRTEIELTRYRFPNPQIIIMKSILHYFRKAKRTTPFYSGSIRQGKVNYRMPETNHMKKWQLYISVITIGGFGLFSLYPLIVDPLLHENEYSKYSGLITSLLIELLY